MPTHPFFRRSFATSSLAVLVWATSWALGLTVSCGGGASAPPGSGAGGNSASDGSAGNGLLGFGTGGTFFIDGGSVGDGSAVGSLHITPAAPVIDITIVDGVVTSISALDAGGATITFQATADGVSVSPSWSIDKGELGTIGAASGVFTATGTFSGAAKVSATYGGITATTTVTIRVHATQNGKTNVDGGSQQAGAGGIGGVGGEGLGGPVDDPTRTRLKGGGTPPTSPQEFGWLYPYDKTVWPNGIFAPLLQWQTTHTASSVYIHLTEANYEFEGFYAGNALVHQPIDQAAWKSALIGNGGDALHVEITVADANKVYGPIAEDWYVAPGVLKGTVYYGSYNTVLATPLQNGKAAAILAIKPGQSDPVLAIPGAHDKCIVCHTVSDDGSTLFAQNASMSNIFDYPDGTSFDLTNGGTPIQQYTGSAPDGTTNNRKFLWSGVSKDGTYALQSSQYTQESYGGASRIFRRDNGNAVTATGFDTQITNAVTPAFSRDGKMVAFNYWQGTLAPGGGNGHTLDVMDFACGAVAAPVAGAPSCNSFGFSNLRRIYTNADQANGFVGWPAWLPDSSGIVFHNVINKPNPGSVLATWNQSKAQIWFVDVPADKTTAPQPIPMRALNGIDAAGNSILPKIAGHDDDYKMNYEPTVNPIASGGYFWVVFTSRRAYGNVAAGDPYDGGDGIRSIPKKLWVAAIDQKPTPGKDPSHPAFYLPGQELVAGNMRGFWVVDACHADGVSCETGDECCNGYCRPDATGKLVCGGKPNGCAQEYEKCTQSSECCGAAMGFECINGFCAEPAQIVK